MNILSTEIRDHSEENRLGKITNKHGNDILGATLQKEGIEKEQ